MPKRPGRLCPRCGRIRHDDHCENCGWRKQAWGWKSDRERGTRQQRGYDQAWLRLRARKLARNPLCEVCLAKGLTEEAKQVHHVKGFRGLRDPLRLAWSNLQSVCVACHEEMTREGSGR